MSTHSPKPVVRFFEFPQVIVSLLPFERSAQYIRRHMKYRCPNLELPSDLSNILEECKITQTVKIQPTLYATGINRNVSHPDVLQILNNSKIVRPCRLSTTIRILLSDLQHLPRIITDPDYCLAILSGTLGESIEVNFVRGTAVHKVYRTSPVHTNTPLIMETDPI